MASFFIKRASRKHIQARKYFKETLLTMSDEMKNLLTLSTALITTFRLLEEEQCVIILPVVCFLFTLAKVNSFSVDSNNSKWRKFYFYIPEGRKCEWANEKVKMRQWETFVVQQNLMSGMVTFTFASEKLYISLVIFTRVSMCLLVIRDSFNVFSFLSNHFTILLFL